MWLYLVRYFGICDFIGTACIIITTVILAYSKKDDEKELVENDEEEGFESVDTDKSKQYI